MERIAAPVIELIWRKLVDSFSSMAVDQMADHALSSVHNIADFEPIFTNLKKNLKSLSAKAADVEEEITNREVSGQKKRKREVKEWLEEVETIKQVVVELGSQIESEGFVMRLTDGGKAAQLNERVKELVEQSRNFSELVLDVRRTSGDTFLTDGMVGEAFSENLERIMELLEKREVSSIGVHGMGGVGKTTLAKHVNNRLRQQAEGRVLWVTVSQEFTIRSLQDKLAHLLGVNLSEKDEEDVRATRLHDALSREKNSVLILDDAWEFIDMKKVGCTFSAECCRLIVTTRSLEVCRRLCCQRVIRVKKLGEEEAWKLFSETLGDETELGPQVEAVAKSVAKMCDGLPLGIITVARSMRGEKAAHMWTNALTELEESVMGQDGMGDLKVFKALKYSFDRLKRNGERESNGFNMIQHCFLYCSLYPEDCRIRRDDLVRKFISEELLDERRSRRGHIVQGRSVLDKLVNLCLLESCISDDDGEECVRMHDLVRSMALRICKGKYMVRAGEDSLKELPNKEEEWTKDLEKVSFIGGNLVCIREGISPDCPKLSTLLLPGNSELKVIPESFICKMQGLRTLDLCWNYQITMLPDSISDLRNLKSLLLEGCGKLEKVPYLGKMKALRELNLSCTAIKEVPRGLEELVNLRFLSMYADRLKMLPRGVLLKFGHLQHLHLPNGIQVEIEEIESLKQLDEFGGCMKNVDDFNRFITTRGMHDPYYSIVIAVDTKDVYGSRRGMREEYEWYDNSFLALCESNLSGKRVLGKGVVGLAIRDCEGLSKCFGDDLSERFDNPTFLRKLEISGCGGIEWIMRSEDGQLSSTLDEVELKALDDLKGVVMERERGEIGAAAAQPTVFPFLKRLVIYECKKMRKVGLSAVSSIPNLEEIWIDSCGEIEEIFEDEGRDFATILSKLTKIMLMELPRLRKVGLPVSALPNLETIIIEGCEEIQEIFEEEEEDDEGRDSATILPKLRMLILKHLPRLRKLGLPAGSSLPNLEVIDISMCNEVEEIFDEEKEDEGRDSATILPKLRMLILKHLPRLRKVGLLAVSALPNLEEIDISMCDEVEEIFEEDGEGRYSSATTLPKSKLRILELKHLPRLRKVGLPASGVPNLEIVLINDCEEVEKIFEDEEEDEGIAADSTLTTILPELYELELYSLPRLKRVSKATIISNSIRSIWITECPELMNKLPLHFDGLAPPPSLTNLRVDREWWESLEWDINNPNLPHLLQPFLYTFPPSLEQIENGGNQLHL